MSVFRINKTTNYTVMSNYHLRDKNLSLKAKGLLSYMLSLPDDWDYSINGLVAINKESIRAIRSILNELRENNYLVINKFQNKKGQFEYEYLIYEQPDIRFAYVDNPPMDNDIQINTNKQNTNNKDKCDKQNPIIKELINREFISEYDLDIPYYDELINSMLEEYDYYDLMRVSGYIINNWKINRGYDADGNKIKNKYGYFKKSLVDNLNQLNKIVDLGY